MNNTETKLKQAIQIRQLASTGRYSLQDLSEQFDLPLRAVRRILNCEVIKEANLIDNLGVVAVSKSQVKTISSVSRTMNRIGFTFPQIATYLNCSRQYAWELARMKTGRRPLVPFVLKEPLQTKTGQTLKTGEYLAQYCDSPEWVLVYTEPDEMPSFVSIEELRKTEKELARSPVILTDKA